TPRPQANVPPAPGPAACVGASFSPAPAVIVADVPAATTPPPPAPTPNEPALHAPPPSHGPTSVATTIAGLNRRAIAAYEQLEASRALRLLNEGLRLCQRAGLERGELA